MIDDTTADLIHDRLSFLCDDTNNIYQCTWQLVGHKPPTAVPQCVSPQYRYMWACGINARPCDSMGASAAAGNRIKQHKFPCKAAGCAAPLHSLCSWPLLLPLPAPLHRLHLPLALSLSLRDGPFPAWSVSPLPVPLPLINIAADVTRRRHMR